MVGVQKRKRKEKWKYVEGFHRLYSVSNMGRVRSENTNRPAIEGIRRKRRGRRRLLSPAFSVSSGMVIVILANIDRTKTSMDLKYLVADHWLKDRTPGARVEYKRKNNRLDCSVSNLREPGGMRLKASDVIAIRKEAAAREGERGALTDISRQYGVTQSCIYRIVSRESWKRLR